MKQKNFGLHLEPIEDTDFILGSSQSLETRYGVTVQNPSADWTHVRPPEENQATKNGDTFACTLFGWFGLIYCLAKYQWGIELNLSARFAAALLPVILGQGADPMKAAMFIRKNWSVLEEEWPDVDTVEEYYTSVPEKLKVLARGRGLEFEFGAERVPNTKTSIALALKSGPVAGAVTAWLPENGVYVRAPWNENHWVVILKILSNGNYFVADSFPPFKKEVKPEAMQSVMMTGYLAKRTLKPSPFEKFISALKRILGL